MQMSRDFIRAMVKDIKAEKDRIKFDLQAKFSSVEAILSTLGMNLEASLRQNFPNMPVMPLIYQQGTMIMPTVYSEGIDTVQGTTEVITTFKRHIEFIKLVSNSVIEMEQLEATFNKYFIYWDNNYRYDRYNKGYSPDAQTKLPNPVMSLDRLSYVLGYNIKNTIQITSGDHDTWTKNAPVEYRYNNNTNQFDLNFDSSLACPVSLSVINDCPELDFNIGNGINKVYMEKLGFDYFKFEEVNNKFIDFITTYLTRFLLIRYQDWTKIKKKNEWDYGNIEILHSSDQLVNFKPNYPTKASVVFKFKMPEDTSSNNKNIEFVIEDYDSNTECTITVKLMGVQQTLVFKLFDRENTHEPISFMGYNKNQNNSTETHLQYFTEDYKLFVLYYGGLLLAKEQEHLNNMETAISNRLAEQEAEEGIKMQTALNTKYTAEEQQAIKDTGYRAQAQGKDMVKDNPYPSTDPEHWLWRKGFVEAHYDSN